MEYYTERVEILETGSSQITHCPDRLSKILGSNLQYWVFEKILSSELSIYYDNGIS